MLPVQVRPPDLLAQHLWPGFLQWESSKQLMMGGPARVVASLHCPGWTITAARKINMQYRHQGIRQCWHIQKAAKTHLFIEAFG